MSSHQISTQPSLVQTGGVPQQLELQVFWLNRPPLMLIPIKLTLFLCSYTYASFLFFLWQFGPSSCAFACVVQRLRRSETREKGCGCACAAHCMPMACAGGVRLPALARRSPSRRPLRQGCVLPRMGPAVVDHHPLQHRHAGAHELGDLPNIFPGGAGEARDGHDCVGRGVADEKVGFGLWISRG